MAIKPLLKRLVVRGAKLAASQAEQVGRDGRNVDTCLAAALGEPDVPSKTGHPTAYVELLRRSVEPIACVVKEIRNELTDSDRAARSFATLVDVLASDVPAISFTTARDMARVAERYRDLSDVVDSGQWMGDVGLLFSISSSFRKKGTSSLPLFGSVAASGAWSSAGRMACPVCSVSRS